MIIRCNPDVHLTYCLNIHPGETLAENLHAIEQYATRVRELVIGRARSGSDGSGDVQDPQTTPFGLGLRLSDAASRELTSGEKLAEFRDFLQKHNLYAFTINGFPFGQFHDAVVKENVYRPDWQEAARRDYTNRLADILAALLPEGVTGSISTVPCSYKAWINSPRQVAAMCRMLAETAMHLQRVHERTGREIVLALEPEPDCYIETTQEVVQFVTGPLRQFGGEHLHSLGLTRQQAEDCLRTYIGMCLDTAHAAVEFEDPLACLEMLRASQVRLAKVQISSAIEADGQSLAKLAEFQDRVYLHQVKVKPADGGAVISIPDLPQALAIGTKTPTEGFPWALDDPRRPALMAGNWRVHFHVPLFFEEFEGLRSTSSLLTGAFAQALRDGACSHLEIETYTFAVLPPQMRLTDVTQSVAREYRWVMEHLLTLG